LNSRSLLATLLFTHFTFPQAHAYYLCHRFAQHRGKASGLDIDADGHAVGIQRAVGISPAGGALGDHVPQSPYRAEAVGRVQSVGPGVKAGVSIGDRVFVGGARCFGPVRGLFGGAAARLVVPADRAVPVPDRLEDPGARAPELIVGHGVLGRLVARIGRVLFPGELVIWERDAARAFGAAGYRVTDAAQDTRRDYRSIIDVSGDAAVLDTLIGRLAPGGQIILAGFYSQPLQFAFAPAFMREASLLIAAQWKPDDLRVVLAMIDDGRLSLDGLITHRRAAREAGDAYRVAFSDPACLKMVLDWRSLG